MKTHLLIALLLWPLWGAAQSCEDIKDEDKAHYCRAINTNKKMHCEKIRNNDTQNLCLAKVERKVTYCNRINTDKIKKRCLSYF